MQPTRIIARKPCYLTHIGRLERIVEPVLHSPPHVARRIHDVRDGLSSLDVDASRIAAGTDAALIVGSLTEDVDLALATLLHAAAPIPDSTAITVLVGETALTLAAELGQFGDFGLASGWRPSVGLDARQSETMRKMLLAVASDPRLVVARLAWQVVRLRAARTQSEGERQRLALEAREIFAPMANRLGVWPLKWELEDLAFRFLEPEDYKRIATALNEKRADRERYIEALCTDLRDELAAAGIQAEVYGRPKHIYSIHRKMLRKQLAFEQVFDVRAVRIVCNDVPQCYAALGVVHGRWPYIQKEFDDYIATPKGNEYRSIHTAVVGPEGKPVEVQIRTPQMHAHAELGVAAHWRYKEGGGRDAQYERKIEWARRLLGPREKGDEQDDFIENVRADLFADRIYALTPKGELVDLQRGATPLDFAYYLHTNLGHRCRGAKVNGRIVPLSYSLHNGEIVEIITGKQPSPSRDWMAAEQGFLASARNRAKVRNWFRRQDEVENKVAGKAIADRELTRLGIGPEMMSALVQELKAHDIDTLHRWLGEGEMSVAQLAQGGERVLAPTREPRPVTRRVAPRGKNGLMPVEVEGVGDLPVTLARCCKPVRPQAIVGYVTLGRGVTIHRADCPSLRRMRLQKPERVLECQWLDAEGSSLPVELTVVGFDRRGLVRDLTDVLASEHVAIEMLNSTTNRREGTATTSMRVGVKDVAQITALLRRLGAVPNVISARRSG